MDPSWRPTARQHGTARHTVPPPCACQHRPPRRCHGYARSVIVECTRKLVNSPSSFKRPCARPWGWPSRRPAERLAGRKIDRQIPLGDRRTHAARLRSCRREPDKKTTGNSLLTQNEVGDILWPARGSPLHPAPYPQPTARPRNTLKHEEHDVFAGCFKPIANHPHYPTAPSIGANVPFQTPPTYNEFKTTTSDTHLLTCC